MDIVTYAWLKKQVGEIDSKLENKADLVDGRIPAEQLPSYVDDIIEYASVADFPNPGEAGKIYVALDSNYTYRWSGSEYVQVGGQDLSEYYTKTETDDLLATKQPVGDYATNSALEAGLAVKANTSDVDAALALKQDVISDLSTIREGAALGATAVQPTDISTISELDIRRLFRTGYTISTTVLNGGYSGDDSIWTEETATVTIEANSGYSLPETIAVSGAAYTYDYTTGVIALSTATGNVSISAECELDLAKGDIIRFDALGDGTQKRFRVIKVDGSTTTLLSLGGTTSSLYNNVDTRLPFDNGVNYQVYEDSVLDSAINTSYYNSLSQTVKQAIIPTNRIQSCYDVINSQFMANQPSDSATLNVHHMNQGKYEIMARLTQKTIGERYCFALDIDDLMEYFETPEHGVMQGADLNELFYETRSGVASKTAWLATASANTLKYIFAVNGDYGYFSDKSYSATHPIYPAFRINLSTIEYTKE